MDSQCCGEGQAEGARAEPKRGVVGGILGDKKNG